MASVRWAFDSAGWVPSAAEWSAATRGIQPEEKTRIGRLQFRRDARAALAGRLLLRRLICRHAGVAWSAIVLGRTERGKPVLMQPAPAPLQFNVSHAGSYTVLAAEPAAVCAALGCDVSHACRRPGAVPLPNFFSTMRRQFTPAEWDYIGGPVPEREQLVRFHRCWALKESYVKAEGVGVGLGLQRLSFTCRPTALWPGRVSVDSVLLVDGRPERRYRFQETMLDSEHVVSVAICDTGNGHGGNSEPHGGNSEPPSFQLISPAQLMDAAEFLTSEDEAYCRHYWACPDNPESC